MQVIESDSLAAVFHTVSSEVKMAAIADIHKDDTVRLIPLHFSNSLIWT